MDRRVTAGRSSIVTRLASRTITGLDPPIQVHQHCYLDLHLVWELSNSNGVPSEACVQRRFLFWDDIALFCLQLVRGGLRGLYSCVTETPDRSLSENVEMCFRAPPLCLEHRLPYCSCIIPVCCCKFSSPGAKLEWDPYSLLFSELRPITLRTMIVLPPVRGDFIP
jgi:hypothetical protein